MLGWFLENTLVAAALTLVVYVVCRWGRFRPAVEHALWLLILIKLLMPTWLAWPHLMGNWVSPPRAMVARSDEMTRAPLASETTRASQVIPAIPPAAVEARPVTQPTRRPAPSHGIPATAGGASAARTAETGWAAWWASCRAWSRQGESLLALWAAGATILTGVQLLQVLRFRRRVRAGQPAPEALGQQWQTLAERLGLCPPAVVTLTGLASPMLWCLGRPRLLWPVGLEQTLDATATESLLVHELAHLRRRDHWVAWLELAATFFWWWNPLFWYVRRRLRQSAEMACDAWVVWALPEGRRSYADSLVTVREWASGGRVIAPAWGALGEVRNLERRLTMIFRDDVRRQLPWGSLVLILLLALAVLPSWSRGEEKKPKPPKTPPAATSAPVTPVAAPAVGVPLSSSGPLPADATIRVFALKHREPDEMISIIRGLWDVTSGQLTVLIPARQLGSTVKQKEDPLGSRHVTPELAREFAISALPVRLVADARTQSLIARGSTEDVDRVAKIVAVADTSEGSPEPPSDQRKAFALKHRRVGEVIEILKNLGIPFRPVPMPADATVSATASQLLLAMGPEKELAEFQQLIQSLDVEESERKIGPPSDEKLGLSPGPPESPSSGF